ncbi:MAG: YrhK family protein [Rhodobacteraceae bacterium]|nr:YrhK family protein [Paracoccaceae bacterium]
MPLFAPGNRALSPRHEQIWAAYEIAHTIVDFTAAALFVIGSILFFFDTTQALATWAFLIGSICFALKPTIRLRRELKFLALGEIDTLAARADE